MTKNPKTITTDQILDCIFPEGVCLFVTDTVVHPVNPRSDLADLPKEYPDIVIGLTPSFIKTAHLKTMQNIYKDLRFLGVGSQATNHICTMLKGVIANQQDLPLMKEGSVMEHMKKMMEGKLESLRQTKPAILFRQDKITSNHIKPQLIKS